jgi:hypothetical protein
MSTLYPLAVIHVASITSLVRTTPCHYGDHTPIQTSGGAAASGGQVPSAAAQNPFPHDVSDIPSAQEEE